MLQQTQHNNEHRQQSRQGAIRKKSQNSDCTLYRNDKEGFGGSSTMFDDSLSNSSQRNDQVCHSNILQLKLCIIMTISNYFCNVAGIKDIKVIAKFWFVSSLRV